MSLKNSNDTIGNRTRDLPVCFNHYSNARPVHGVYSLNVIWITP